MAPNCYSQLAENLPLRELNNEFLKGIKARERVVVLKQIIAADSAIISNYKDSVVPVFQHSLDTARQELIYSYLETEKYRHRSKIYGVAFLSTLTLFLVSLFS